MPYKMMIQGSTMEYNCMKASMLAITGYEIQTNLTLLKIILNKIILTAEDQSLLEKNPETIAYNITDKPTCS